MASPKLRFKEFKADWTNTSLGLLSDKIGDGIHATPDYDNQGEIPFINGNNLIDGVVTINENTKRINVSEFQKYKQNLSNQTIFLSINGTIGNLAFYQNEKLLLGKSVCFINLKQTVDKFFVYQILQSPLLKKTFNSELTGTTIKNLSLATVRSSDFFCPHKEEQTQIAFFLSAVDEKINQLTQKHELLSQYKQGMMQKLFSQQIRFKADDGKEFGEWEEKFLKEFFPKIRNGFVGVATPYYVESGVKYLQGKNIKNGKIDATGLIYINNEFHQKKTNSILHTNDILMVQSGHVGECAVVTDEYKNGNCHALLVLTPKSSQIVNSEFVVYYFYSEFGKKKITLIKTGNTIEHILASDIKEVSMLFPCIEEQTKIANFLDAIDQKIAGVAQQIVQTKQWKKGLLQQMFV